MNKTILLVEDDPKIADLIGRYLDAEHFSYYLADSGALALSLFEQVKPDLVILDIMLPQMKGTAVCEKIRATSEVPIIIVTALADDTHLLDGFAKGADDYLCKPFNPRELIARIRAIFRRSSNEVQNSNTLTYDALYVDLDERIVKVHDAPVELTQTEFNLLSMLIANPNRVLSRETLRNGSHDSFTESYARSVDFHIKNLRRKINTTEKLSFIKTIYGVGYKLI